MNFSLTFLETILRFTWHVRILIFIEVFCFWQIQFQIILWNNGKTTDVVNRVHCFVLFSFWICGNGLIQIKWTSESSWNIPRCIWFYQTELYGRVLLIIFLVCHYYIIAHLVGANLHITYDFHRSHFFKSSL